VKTVFLLWTYLFFLLVIFILPFYSAEGYSIIKNTTSQLGAQHTPNAQVMNITFVLLGLATIIDARRFLENFWLHKIVLTVFGIALILAAFYRHAPIAENLPFDISEDKMHSVFATITGTSFTFFAIASVFIEKSFQNKAIAFLAGIFATAMSIMMFTLTDFTGIWQRLLLITSFAWLIFFFKTRQK
jgi:hypothetical protein